MSYTKSTDFLAKDSLITGNPSKKVKGSELDTEFNNIATADADNVKTSALGSGIATFLTTGTTLGTEQQTTSGTAINFTSIPSWAKQIKVMFAQVSMNTNHTLAVQIGDSGGIEATGYQSLTATGGSGSFVDTAFGLTGLVTGSFLWSGTLTLDLEDSTNNHWVATWVLGSQTGGSVYIGGGDKALSGTLDRLRITDIFGGAPTFDGGAVNISYSP